MILTDREIAISVKCIKKDTALSTQVVAPITALPSSQSEKEQAAQLKKTLLRDIVLFTYLGSTPAAATLVISKFSLRSHPYLMSSDLVSSS